MNPESAVKLEIDSSNENSVDISTVKVEDGIEKYGTFENSVDISIVKVEDGIEECGTFEYITNATSDYDPVRTSEEDLTKCKAEISQCENIPFKLSLIDEDGNILETYFQENGILKPVASPNGEANNKTQNKKTLKNKRLYSKNCEKVKFKNKSHRKQVIDETFRNENYCCSICKHECKGRKSFKAHLGLHIKEENNRFWCCFCDYSAGLRGHLNTHIMRKHAHFRNSNVDDERIFSCKICKKKFFERRDLKRHMFVHTEKGHLKCRFCEFSHVRQSSFDNHMRLVHKVPGSVSLRKRSETVEICECDYCGYKCRGKRSITVHIERHLGVFRYKCDQCGYSCLFSGDLKKHIAIHSNERPFVCNICSKAFKRKHHLFLHNNKKNSCKEEVKNLKKKK